MHDHSAGHDQHRTDQQALPPLHAREVLGAEVEVLVAVAVRCPPERVLGGWVTFQPHPEGQRQGFMDQGVRSCLIAGCHTAFTGMVR